MAASVNLKDPAFNPKNENPRAVAHKLPTPEKIRASKVGLVPTEQVNVRCYVENKPHAYVYEKDEDGNDVRRLRTLDKGEIAIVDRDVAEVVEKNEHAFIWKGDA